MHKVNVAWLEQLLPRNFFVLLAVVGQITAFFQLNTVCRLDQSWLMFLMLLHMSHNVNLFIKSCFVMSRFTATGSKLRGFAG